MTRIGVPPTDPLLASLVEDCRRPVWHGDPIAFSACMDSIDQLEAYLEPHEREIADLTSAEELELIRIHLVSFRSWRGQTFWSGERSLEVRDQAMAEVFLRLSNLWYPGLKSVIWAHNFHIERNSEGSIGTRTMGSWLNDALGADCVILGLVGYDVAIDWPTVGCGGPTAFHGPASVETILDDLTEPFLLADLRRAGSLVEPGRYYVVDGYITVPGQLFDGVFFLHHSPKMTPQAWAPCDDLSAGSAATGKELD